MFDFLDKTGLKTVLEQIKAKFPSSLPANGGNADYATNAGNANAVGGIQISYIRQITRNTIQTLPTPPIAECDYFVSNADSTFPYYFGNLSIRYGSYTGEFVAIYQTTGDDKSIWYNLYLGGWVGWKEISTTPIKSTGWITTPTNAYGDIYLAESDSRKYISVCSQGSFSYMYHTGSDYVVQIRDGNMGKVLSTPVTFIAFYID